MELPKPRHPLLLRFYFDFLESEDSAAFIRAVTRNYTGDALERLSSSGDRTIRRAAVLALGLTADYTANEALGRALGDEDRAVRLLAENGLKAVWRRQGSAAQRARLERIRWTIRSGEFAAAVVDAGALLCGTPWIAEAWRQRGIAYFHQRRFHAALGDFQQTLELNSYHFAAAEGIGHCHRALNNPAAALESFQRALRLNPGLEGVRAQVHHLQRSRDYG